MHGMDLWQLAHDLGGTDAVEVTFDASGLEISAPARGDDRTKPADLRGETAWQPVYKIFADKRMWMPGAALRSSR